MTPLIDVSKKIRYELYSFLGQWDAIYLPLVRIMGKHNTRIVKPTTEIVIEGFPRSANTFAVVAFRQAQARTVEIAHHLHTVAQVSYAAKHNIPIMLLVRPPQDAIVSLVIRHPYISLKQALRAYIRFYLGVAKLRDQLIVVTFDEAISNLSVGISRINEKYSVEFNLFAHSETSVAQCFEEIERLNKKFTKNTAILETMVARPSQERATLKKEIAADLSSIRFARLLRNARSAYDKMLDSRSI